MAKIGASTAWVLPPLSMIKCSSKYVSAENGHDKAQFMKDNLFISTLTLSDFGCSIHVEKSQLFSKLFKDGKRLPIENCQIFFSVKAVCGFGSASGFYAIAKENTTS